jgi:hypothetical protein
MEGR